MTHAWFEGRMTTFDVETTGTDYETDRIVTASVATVGGGYPTAARSWLINPGVEIPEGAAKVHGISNERAQAEGVDPAGAVEEIVSALHASLQAGAPIVAFNARFDLTMLDREARRHGVVALVDRVGGAELLRVVDPYVLDKEVDRFRRGKRILTVVCEHYGVELGDDAHDADADALAAARLAYRMAKRYPVIGDLSLSELYALQITWAADQAASLEDYHRSRGRLDGDYPRDWPMVPAVGAVIS